MKQPPRRRSRENNGLIALPKAICGCRYCFLLERLKFDSIYISQGHNQDFNVLVAGDAIVMIFLLTKPVALGNFYLPIIIGIIIFVLTIATALWVILTIAQNVYIIR